MYKNLQSAGIKTFIIFILLISKKKIFLNSINITVSATDSNDIHREKNIFIGKISLSENEIFVHGQNSKYVVTFKFKKKISLFFRVKVQHYPTLIKYFFSTRENKFFNHFINIFNFPLYFSSSVIIDVTILKTTNWFSIY